MRPWTFGKPGKHDSKKNQESLAWHALTASTLLPLFTGRRQPMTSSRAQLGPAPCILGRRGGCRSGRESWAATCTGRTRDSYQQQKGPTWAIPFFLPRAGFAATLCLLTIPFEHQPMCPVLWGEGLIWGLVWGVGHVYSTSTRCCC